MKGRGCTEQPDNKQKFVLNATAFTRLKQSENCARVSESVSHNAISEHMWGAKGKPVPHGRGKRGG